MEKAGGQDSSMAKAVDRQQSEESNNSYSSGSIFSSAFDADFSAIDLNRLTKTHRELRNLSFKNPGNALTGGDRGSRKRSTSPSSSSISSSSFSLEPRRSSRRIERLSKDGNGSNASSFAQAKRQYKHDRDGHFIKDDGIAIQLCDCLQVECPGCWMPCSKCHSRRCGTECQINRSSYVAQIRSPEGDPTPTVFHPFVNDKR